MRAFVNTSVPLNVIVQMTFQSVQVFALLGQVVPIRKPQRQVDAGIGESFLRLQRAKEILIEWQEQLAVGSLSICI